MTRESRTKKQIALYVDKMVLSRASELAERLSRADYRLTSADVLRLAIDRGLIAIESETAKPKKTRKA